MSIDINNLLLKMIKKLLILFGLQLCFCFNIQAQMPPSDFETSSAIANGRYYALYQKIHSRNNSTKKILRRDFVSFYLQTATASGKVLVSNFGEVPFTKEISVDDPETGEEGFIQSMLLRLNIGDSATFAVKAEDLFQAIKRPISPKINKDELLFYTFKILQKQIWEEVERDNKQSVFDQSKKDEKEIASFVAKNLPGAKRTYSGLWYKIEFQGEGDFAVEDDVVAINYVGRFLDGQAFGSSDKDGRLLEFPVGRGFVIKGLDEALPLLRKGAKAIFVIPSYLAYGSEGWGNLIPPDAPLVFEIDFVDILLHKIIIQNKAQLNAQDKSKAKEQGMSLEEYFESIEKQMRKGKVKNIKFGDGK